MASEVAALVEEAWGWRAERIDYAAVGFGSYHWYATAGGTELVVTLDVVGGMTDPGQRAAHQNEVVRAFRTASRLAGAGFEFVRGPLPTRDGDVVVRRGVQVFSVWPYIAGRSSREGDYTSDDDRRAVLAILSTLHGAVPSSLGAGMETFEPAQRPFLERVLADPGPGWDRGPYGARALALLRQCREGVRRLLAYYDDVTAATPPMDTWVVTHGEPHAANVVFGERGPVLIDWDTVKIAPRERDLWMVMTGDAAVDDVYAPPDGVGADPDLLRLYAAHWELSEIGSYLNHFRSPHGDNADDVVSWNDLQGYLPVEPRWADL